MEIEVKLSKAEMVKKGRNVSNYNVKIDIKRLGLKARYFLAENIDNDGILKNNGLLNRRGNLSVNSVTVAYEKFFTENLISELEKENAYLKCRIDDKK